MQDSYNELINDVSVIKLIDCEVNWIDFHKEINAFCNVTQEEYNYWKDKKILIKDVSCNDDTVIKYSIYLENLRLNIKNNRRELNITDTDLQDLRDKREELNFITNSIKSIIWDDWGRDHEHYGGKWINYAEKGTTPKGKYNPKFNVSKLFSIFRGKCKVENVGGDYESSNYFATNFIANEGEKVYITGGFLELLKDIFYLRLTTLDNVIKELEPKNTKTGKPQEQPKGYYLGLSVPQLKTLHALLIGKFLDSNTSIDHFKNAFNGEELKDFEPLKWIGSKAVLSLFVGLLNHDNKWKIAESIFENCDSRNLAKSFNNCNPDGKPLNKHKPNISLFKSILP